MEYLLGLTALLLILSFLLKCSFLPRLWVAVFSVLMGTAVLLAIPWITRQSQAGFEAWVSSPNLMLDAAVCIVLEVVLMTVFCFSRPSGRLRRLAFYPGLPAIPAACAVWGRVLFSYPGLNFTRFAWIAALATVAIAYAACRLIRRLVPEEDLRLESLFIVNMFLLLMTVAATGAITF